MSGQEMVSKGKVKKAIVEARGVYVFTTKPDGTIKELCDEGCYKNYIELLQSIDALPAAKDQGETITFNGWISREILDIYPNPVGYNIPISDKILIQLSPTFRQNNRTMSDQTYIITITPAQTGKAPAEKEEAQDG